MEPTKQKIELADLEEMKPWQSWAYGIKTNDCGYSYLWVACKSKEGVMDWAIYMAPAIVLWGDLKPVNLELIKMHGTKVTSMETIKSLVNVSDDVLKLYRK